MAGGDRPAKMADRIKEIVAKRLERGIRDLVGHDNSERALAGRRYVEDHCDWRAIGRRFAGLAAQHTFS